jgi:hypothetical protein
MQESTLPESRREFGRIVGTEGTKAAGFLLQPFIFGGPSHCEADSYTCIPHPTLPYKIREKVKALCCQMATISETKGALNLIWRNKRMFFLHLIIGFNSKFSSTVCTVHILHACVRKKVAFQEFSLSTSVAIHHHGKIFVLSYFSHFRLLQLKYRNKQQSPLWSLKCLFYQLKLIYVVFVIYRMFAQYLDKVTKFNLGYEYMFQ